jgi:hypothetical protein
MDANDRISTFDAFPRRVHAIAQRLHCRRAATAIATGC